MDILASPDEVCFLLVDAADERVGSVEGAVHPAPPGPYAHVEGWYVAPEHRGQGRGRDLIGALEPWCLHRAIRLLTSDTTPDYPRSPAAHARAGFRKIHEFTIFRKDLRSETGARTEDSPALLVVTGVSGAGKTAVLRALAERDRPGVVGHHFDTIGVPTPDVIDRDFGGPDAIEIHIEALRAAGSV